MVANVDAVNWYRSQLKGSYIDGEWYSGIDKEDCVVWLIYNRAASFKKFQHALEDAWGNGIIPGAFNKNIALWKENRKRTIAEYEGTAQHVAGLIKESESIEQK